MKPPPFRYYRAKNAAAVVQALSSPEWAGGARILAGGQSLVPALAVREIRPTLLVDIMHCNDLGGMSASADCLIVGAACRQSELERSPLVQNTCPLLAEAITWVAVPQVRSRGTVIGNLVQNNPGGELPLCAMVLDAAFEVLDANGYQTTKTAQEVYGIAAGTTFGPTSMVLAVRFAAPKAQEGWGFTEIQLRRGHLALVCAAATVEINDGRITSVRVGIGGMTTNPYRAHEAEAFLIGHEAADEAIMGAAAQRAVSERPWSSRADLHAPAEYRETVAVVAARDALNAARRRALECGGMSRQ